MDSSEPDNDYMENFTFYGHPWKILHKTKEVSFIEWHPEELNRRHGLISFMFENNTYLLTYKFTKIGNKNDRHIKINIIFRYENGDIVSNDHNIYKLIV